MKWWPWSKKPAEADPVPDDIDEARRARARAEFALRQEHSRSGEIRKEAARSKRHWKENHFIELFLDTFERGPR